MQFVKQIFFIAANCTFIKYSDERRQAGNGKSDNHSKEASQWLLICKTLFIHHYLSV